MKTFIIIALIASVAMCQSAQITILGDIPSCVTDLKADFTSLETAIESRSWLKLEPVIVNLFKSFMDCKEAYNEIKSCSEDVIPAVVDLITLYKTVKAKDMNPLHYIHSITDAFSKIKAATHDCYFKLSAEMTPVRLYNKDMKTCGADLKTSWNDLKYGFENKDVTVVVQLAKDLMKIVGDCKGAFNEIEECKTAVTSVIQDVGALISDVHKLDYHPSDYINNVEDIWANGGLAIEVCYTDVFAKDM